MTHPPLDLEELAKLANERIQFVKDTELDFHAGGDTRLAEGVLRLLAECESLRAEVDETRDALVDACAGRDQWRKTQLLLNEAEKALESSNKTILYLMEEYAQGHGLTIGRMTVDNTNQTLAKIRQAKG